MTKSELIAIVEKYISFDEAEKNHQLQVLEFLREHDNCFSRKNLTGHMVGGGLLVSQAGDKVLMNYHDTFNRWLQFGGHADGEIDLLAVGLRETQEESGIEEIKVISKEIFDIDSHRIPTYPKKNEPEHQHYELRYVFKTAQKEFVVSEESKRLQWFGWEEAIRLAEDEGLKRLLVKGKRVFGAKSSM